MAKKDPKAQEPENQPDAGEDVDKTVDVNSADSTVEIQPSETGTHGNPKKQDDEKLNRTARQQKTVVHRGKTKVSMTTFRDESRTDHSDGNFETADLDIPLVMASEAIGATINTRELTGNDAEIWATVIAGSSVESVTGGMSTPDIGAAKTRPPSPIVSADARSTTDIPAIDRTISDRNFDRLRICDVTSLKNEPKVNSDYRLVRKLGQGGMGDVFVARQGSLDRLLALKLIRPIDGKRRQKLMQTGRLEEVEQERKLQFLSEAIVTGDLDHPNIVPIHDVAMTDKGDLFYSMKRVIGTPWSDEIDSMSLDDNVDVLLKVCDAIAMAHARGVVHRDIKPENIMLGEFGVVMVMDWGLALPTPDYGEKRPSAVLTTTGLGGTPAFMAPEMATGPISRIGPASDIYLLGATLFMMITGKAPHHASTVTECLQAVRENRIRDVKPEHDGELLEIAYRAMETNPANRYEDVLQFQESVRDYIKHSSSIGQSHQAADLLDIATEQGSYEHFSQARYKFEAALSSWSENLPAQQGLEETRIKHAEAALANEDFDLGISLLDDQSEDHLPLVEQLLEGKRQRVLRESRLQLLKKLAVAMLLFILIGGGIAIYAINLKRNQATEALALAERNRVYAEEQKDEAEQERIRAEQQEMLATREKIKAEAETVRANSLAKAEAKAKSEALMQRSKAIAQKAKAEQSEQKAVDAQRAAELARADAEKKKNQAIAATQKANYEEYVSKIGLAKAHLDRNEAEVARQILRELKNKSPHANGWEFRWLWRQAGGSQSETDLPDPPADFSFIPKGNHGVVLTEGGEIQSVKVDSSGEVQLKNSCKRLSQRDGKAVSVAVSADKSVVAVGYARGDIMIQQSDRIDRLGTHEGSVNDLQFVKRSGGKQLLISGSSDRTVRVWDVESKTEVTASAACWHGLPVRRIASVVNQSDLLIAVATSSEKTGQIELWRIALTGTIKQQETNQTSPPNRLGPEKIGVFNQHQRPVSAIALRHDGKLAASGDVDGNVLLWNTSTIENIDYESAIAKALQGESGNEKNVASVRLIDRDLPAGQSLISKSSNSGRSVRKRRRPTGLAHADVVQAIAFSDSGNSIVSASNDYTLKKWETETRKLTKKMRGHGGWVSGVSFVGDGADEIVSVSNDHSLRTWKPSTYVGDAVLHHIEYGKLVSAPVNGKPNSSNGSRAIAQPHEFDVASAKFSPDGSRVVTASRDHTATVMTIDPVGLTFVDPVQLGQKSLVEGTEHVALSMETDGQEKLLFIGSADATIRYWDIKRGVQLGEVSGTGINGSIGVSEDGSRVLTGSSSPNANAVLWQIDPSGIKKPKPLYRLLRHDQAVTALAISPDGKWLFTGDGIGFGVLWDAESGKPIGEPIDNVRGFRINVATFANDSQSLWIGADDGQLTQVDLNTRKIMTRLNHDGFVTKLSIHHQGTHAVTVSELLGEKSLESTATLWDLRSKSPTQLDQRVNSFSGETGSGSGSRNRVTSAAFGKSGDTVIVGVANRSRQSAIKVWRFANDKIESVTSTISKPDLAFALPSRIGAALGALPINDGQCLTLNRNAAFAWGLEKGTLRRSYRAHAELTEADFSPDGKWVATTSRSVKFWNSETGKVNSKLEAPHAGAVRSLSFRPIANGNISVSAHQESSAIAYKFATGGDDSVIRFWKWQPGKDPQRTRTIEVNPVTRINVVRYSDDGKRLLAGCDGGIARVYQLDDSDRIWKLNPNANGLDISCRFLCGDFSSDGNHVAMGGTDDTARMWQLNPNALALNNPVVMRGHADTIRGIRITGSHDKGYRVFTGSADDSVKVWDPTDRSDLDQPTSEKRGREILSLRKHRGDVTAVDMSADGLVMMTAGSDGQVILWPSDPAEDIAENLFDQSQ